MPESVEMEWMEADPARFERLAGDSRWGVFHRRAPDPE
jgi:hypothetical protein